MDTIQSPWLSSREGAAYARMSQTEFGKLVARGEIPSYKRGKTKFVNALDIDAWMRSHPSGASVPEILRSA